MWHRLLGNRGIYQVGDYPHVVWVYELVRRWEQGCKKKIESDWITTVLSMVV
jgi:hypothetical protein